MCSLERGLGGEPGDILKGTRNVTLFKLGCGMRGGGFVESAIRAALHAQNKECCKPPLSESEVDGIADSVAKYKAGKGLGSISVPEELWSYGLNPCVALYEALSGYANSETGKCWPSLETLAEDIGVRSTNTVRKYLKILKENGLVDWTEVMGQSNTYTVKTPSKL